MNGEGWNQSLGDVFQITPGFFQRFPPLSVRTDNWRKSICICDQLNMIKEGSDIPEMIISGQFGSSGLHYESF